MKTVPNHETRAYTGIVLERIKHLPSGGRVGDLPAHLQHESFIRMGDKKTGGLNMRLLRLKMDEPALTVTAYIFNKFVHPYYDRYLTPREAACLQDFPVDYAFKGTLGQTQKQVGNAVPVKLAKAIAGEIAQYFIKRNYSATGQHGFNRLLLRCVIKHGYIANNMSKLTSNNDHF